MRRRDFITLLGGAAAAWPLTARAQQSAMPVVGFLQPGSPAESGHFATAFLTGLKDTGYVEGDSLRVEYRWAEGRYERFSQFAEDLVKRNVRVIAAGGPPATLAAKSATSTIPIVFITGDDPVTEGLVASFNRPGGNLTGVTVFATASMWGKRLELLHEFVPSAVTVAMLANPQDPFSPDMSDMIPAARALGIQLSLLTAATDAGIEGAFAAAAERRIEALLVSDRPFFTVRPKQIAALGARHALPVVYSFREHVEAGGLISYGINLRANYRRAAFYVDRILKGEKPADLPVEFPTKVELVVNLATAKALGLTIPTSLLARADEVIE